MIRNNSPSAIIGYSCKGGGGDTQTVNEDRTFIKIPNCILHFRGYKHGQWEYLWCK